MSKTRNNSDLNCKTSDCLIKISVAGARGPGHRSTNKWRRAQAAKPFKSLWHPSYKLGFPGQKWTVISFPEMNLKADFDALIFLSKQVMHAFPLVPTAEFDNSFHASQHHTYKVNLCLPAYTNTRAGAETDRKQQSRARWNRGAVRLKPVASQKLSHAELDPKLLSGPGVFLFISSSSSLAKRGRAMSGQAEFVAWTATALLGLAVQTLEQTYAMKKHE